MFIDVSQAFDSLDHKILLKKLEHCGVRSVALNWFNSFFTHSFQFIELDGSRSLLKMNISGVPQGSTLGLHLYTVYVNDIFNVVLNVKFILYADDTTLLLHDSSILKLINTASTVFQLFSIWFIDNKLCLNSKKTNFMVFSRYKNSFAPATLTFDSHVVYRVDNVRYLGYFIDDKLNWQNHISNVNSKVLKCIGMIKRCSSFLPRFCLLTIYYSFIFPYLSSGIEFCMGLYY